MRFAREIRLRRVKCLRAWVDLFHFTLRQSRKTSQRHQPLFYIERSEIFHYSVSLTFGVQEHITSL